MRRVLIGSDRSVNASCWAHTVRALPLCSASRRVFCRELLALYKCSCFVTKCGVHRLLRLVSTPASSIHTSPSPAAVLSTQQESRLLLRCTSATNDRPGQGYNNVLFNKNFSSRLNKLGALGHKRRLLLKYFATFAFPNDMSSYNLKIKFVIFFSYFMDTKTGKQGKNEKGAILTKKRRGALPLFSIAR